MVGIVDYYLKHDKERQKIALNAYNKVNSLFSYENQIKKILEIYKGL